jgi:hypothetical protein
MVRVLTKRQTPLAHPPLLRNFVDELPHSYSATEKEHTPIIAQVFLSAGVMSDSTGENRRTV